jgi:hypothetical protein
MDDAGLADRVRFRPFALHVHSAELYNRPTRLKIPERAVVLISRPALRLLSDAELQATVAHEMGHDYFWRDDAVLRAWPDSRSLQVVELKCDGGLTLLALESDPDHLYRAIERIARFNGVPNARWQNNGYPHPRDRKPFGRALLDLIRHGVVQDDRWHLRASRGR